MGRVARQRFSARGSALIVAFITCDLNRLTCPAVMNWSEARKFHLQAAEEVVSTARRVPADKWLVGRAEGKWSPAEIVEHLNLAYEVLLRELAGGRGMEIRTKLWQRFMLRLTIMPKLLRGGPFPAGTRAPREIRPATASPDQAAAIAALTDRAARFDAATAEAQRTNPRKRLTHAYFGRSTIDHAVLLCARHLQHHHKQLVEVSELQRL